MIQIIRGKAIPKAHKTSHQNGGTDEISVAGLSGELADDQPSNFLKLSDAPSSYAGEAGKYAKVNTAEDALEFATPVVTPTKIQDADADTYEDTEKTADVDEIVSYVKDILARTIHDNGIIDFPKQSAARGYRSSAVQTIVSDQYVKIALDGEDYDVQDEFDPTTNYRFTVTEDGFYCMAANLVYSPCTADKRYASLIYVNGSVVTFSNSHAAGTGPLSCPASDILELAANDYVELYTRHSAGVNRNVSNLSKYTYLALHKIS